MQIEDIRRDYKLSELSEQSIHHNPFQQFQLWMSDALSAAIQDATAMSLVSIDTDGFPQSRIVLLKDFDERGFTFFTNYKSNKGKAMEKNAKVSLHFFWSELERQIRISGFARKTSEDISKTYFFSRPRKSQIAASISEQSARIPSRHYLENKFNELSEKLKGENTEYPPCWGGYLVEAIKFEFWQGRENRLHDRIVYEKSKNKWEVKRLAP